MPPAPGLSATPSACPPPLSHADWDGLLATMEETGAREVWITHGREEALAHAAGQRGIRARALALVGYEEEGS